MANKGTAERIMEGIINNVPLEWILPVVFSKILSSIKNPNSSKAKALESVLVSFGQALASKYPGKICSNGE